MKYNKEVIEFFKKHNMYDINVFDYLQANSNMIDYQFPEERCLIGCIYIQDKNGILKRLIINIPYVYDEETMLINIHEITHGIENYFKLGKKFQKDITIETLPMLFEKIYILEHPSEKLEKYANYLDELAASNDKEYGFALKVRNELLAAYNGDLKKTKRLIKKLKRKYS